MLSYSGYSTNRSDVIEYAQHNITEGLQSRNHYDTVACVEVSQLCGQIPGCSDVVDLEGCTIAD